MIKNGLQRLVLIGSAGYRIAELPLDASVSLIASNNTGKTSLINALQFLLVADKRRMDFGGYNIDQSRKFYFPNNQSYILVEALHPISGTVVIGCVGKGVSHDYQYFSYKGALQIEDYKMGDGSIVNQPKLSEHLASRGKIVHFYQQNEFKDALCGGRKKLTATEPDITIFHLEHQSDADTYRRVLHRTLSLDKLNAEYIKGHLLSIFAREMPDSEMDFNKEWERAFAGVNQKRDQYRAALALREIIQRRAVELQDIKILRGKLIDWKPRVENGLTRWNQHYKSSLLSLEQDKSMVIEEQRQLNQRLIELTTTALTKKAELDSLNRDDQRQKHLERKFALVNELELLEAQRQAVADELERQITLLGQVRGRKVDSIKGDLDKRKKELAGLKRQRETISDSLYCQLCEQLSMPEVERLNRVLQPDVMKLALSEFSIDIDAVKAGLAQYSDKLLLLGITVNDASLESQFTQLTSQQLEEQILDYQAQISSLEKQLEAAKEMEKAEEKKKKLEAELQEREMDIREYRELIALIDGEESRSISKKALVDSIEECEEKKESANEYTQSLTEKINDINKSDIDLRSKNANIVSFSQVRGDRAPQFGYLEDRPKIDWVAEPEWQLDQLDAHLSNYNNECARMLTLDKALVNGIIELHSKGLTKFQDMNSYDEEWKHVIEFEQNLEKEGEVIQKECRSAVVNVSTGLTQIRKGLSAFNREMDVFNKLISQRKISDLRVFKIVPRNEEHIVAAIDTILAEAKEAELNETRQMFDCTSVLDNEAIERAKQTLIDEGNERNGLRVSDLFRLEFVIGKEGHKEESFEDMDNASSNGTVIMAKLVTGLAMLYRMQHKTKRFRTICYLDEAHCLDTENQRSLVEIADGFGFSLICASPTPLMSVRYCVPIDVFKGKNVITRKSWQIFSPLKAVS